MLAISLFLITRLRLNASIAPFFTILGISLTMCIFSMFNLLVVSVWLILAFAACCVIYIFVFSKVIVADVARQFFTPGMVFFIVTSVFFFIALDYRNPPFLIWDEFSFWGTAAKAVFQHNQLYTLFTSSMINNSYAPTLPLWSYFIQFFGMDFIEWKVYLAYDMLAMSVMAILFARLKWKNVITIVVLFAFSLTSLYMFWDAYNLILYCTSYADLTIGVVFGGVILSYFFGSDNNLMRWIVTLVGLFTLPLIKDIGMALGLIAAGIIFIDMLISGNYPVKTLVKSEKKWTRILLPLLLFAVVLLSYNMWNVHYQAATGISRATVPYEYSVIEIFSGKDSYFNEIVDLMREMLQEEEVVSFWSINTMITVFTLIPIVTGALTLDKKKILRLAIFSVFMLGGFALYYLFMAYSYTAIFAHDYQLPSLSRYLSTYFAGWLLATIGVCMSELVVPKFKSAAKSDRATKPQCIWYLIKSYWHKLNRKGLVTGTIAAALLVVFVFQCNTVPAEQYVFLSKKIEFHQSSQYIIRTNMQRFNGFYDYITDNDRIYFICQESNGNEWFIFNYESMPAYTVNTLGGGNFIDPAMPDGEKLGLYDARVGRQDFIDYVRQERINLLYVYRVNDYFSETFGSMFTDELAGFYNGSVAFYYVVDNGGSDVTFAAIYQPHALEEMRAEYGN